MIRSVLLATAALAGLALSACNARDEGNGSTVISVDENAVKQGIDQTGNAVGIAAGEVKQAAEKAGPALENAADKTGAAAKRAGQSVEGAVENTDVDVDVTTNNKQNR
jgi:ABC-type Fe3+-hydroxamate transport system substrate-binding protein